MGANPHWCLQLLYYGFSMRNWYNITVSSSLMNRVDPTPPRLLESVCKRFEQSDERRPASLSCCGSTRFVREERRDSPMAVRFAPAHESGEKGGTQRQHQTSGASPADGGLEHIPRLMTVSTWVAFTTISRGVVHHPPPYQFERLQDKKGE